MGGVILNFQNICLPSITDFGKEPNQVANNTERFSYFIQLTHKNTNLLQNDRNTHSWCLLELQVEVLHVLLSFSIVTYFTSLFVFMFPNNMGIICQVRFLPSSARFNQFLIQQTRTIVHFWYEYRLHWPESDRFTPKWRPNCDMRALAKSTSTPFERRVFIL